MMFPKPEDTEASQRNSELRSECPEEPYKASEANSSVEQQGHRGLQKA